MKVFSKFLFLVFAIVMIGCGDDGNEVTPVTPVEEPQTIADIATSNDDFSTLVSALSRVNLVETLQSDGPFTVFAPTNAAFAALGVDLATISDEDLTNILLYHVIGGNIASTDLADGQTYAGTAAAGPSDHPLSMLIEKGSAGVKVNNVATVTTADVTATNGVIHIVDAVITPLDIVGHAAANSNFTSLVGALGAASGDLVSVLQGDGPFTVFAPVNGAFDAISEVTATLSADQLANVLTYHVASGNVKSGDLTNGLEVMAVNEQIFTVNIGDQVTLTDGTGEQSTVVLTDVQATNGVIHVLDRVILPAN